MADFTTTYTEVEPDAVLRGRRKDIPLVDGPASLLALVADIGVPIFAKRQIGGGGAYSVGGGLSFAVGKALNEVRLNKDTCCANRVRPTWFNRVAASTNNPEVVEIKSYVTKRIVTPRRQRDVDKHDMEVETFMAMTNEIRILAHEDVRRSQNIIALIGLSWDIRETNGRFLPEVLLEGAIHSSLSQYIKVSHHQLEFLDQAIMLLDVTSGLSFLHENGIVHCDVKTSNILLCDCTDRQSLDLLGAKPYIAKLCDFGCSVILSDYTEDHQFMFRRGTPGWMAPEMEQCQKLDSGALLKTDIYSLGQVAAVIAIGTQLSLDAVSRLSVTSQAATSNNDNITLDIERVSTLLVATNKGKALNENQIALFSAVILDTMQSDPSKRAETAQIFQLCRRHVLEEIRDCQKKRLLHLNLDDDERLISTFTKHPGKVSSKFEVGDNTDIATVPDFAFESVLKSSQLPRECRKEVYRDLERKASSSSKDAGECVLQLAGLTVNGYLDDYGQMEERVESYLVRAISFGNEVALSGAINLFKAMGRELPADSRVRVLQRYRDPGFRAKSVFEIKSLFFPLAFDMHVAPHSSTIPSYLLHTYRQDINEKIIGVRSWTRECKQDFAEYIRSPEYRRTLYKAVLRLVNQHDLLQFQRGQEPPFDSRLDDSIHYSETVFDNQIKRRHDVSEEGTLDRNTSCVPPESKFTLLQLAVCRGDVADVTEHLQECLPTDIDACGHTPNWTPLWLACLLGYYEIAVLLIKYHADLKCQDSNQGISILHLLTQFSSKTEVESMGLQALSAGLDVNVKCRNNVTPLLASMLVFDYSDGAAVQFLLDKGANPLIPNIPTSEMYPPQVSPLSLCILNLDTTLFDMMLAARLPISRDESEARALISSVTAGFQFMRTKTAFRAMFEAGEMYKTNIKSMVRNAITFDEVRRKAGGPGLTPLAFAYDIDRADLLQEILEENSATSMDVEDSYGKVNLLEQCIARHNFRCVKALIQHGADILGTTEIDPHLLSLDIGDQILKGESRLAAIAKDMPLILGFALEHLEHLPAGRRGGRTVRNILRSRQVDTAGIFDTLVLHGTSEEIAIAEALRVKYRLSHDRVQPFPPDTTTLIGSLVVWSGIYGYGRLDQIRYLLSLKPKPRFYLPSKINLLQLTLIQSEGTEHTEQIELIRMLLCAYPEMENLTRGWRHNLPPLLQAATGTNLELIRLLEDHVKIMHTGKSFPYNHLHLRAETEEGLPAEMTMLDACNLGIKDRGLVDHKYGYGLLQGSTTEDGAIKISAVEQLRRHYCRKAIYKHLREMGAQLWWELYGYIISARFLWINSVSTHDLYTFLQKLTTKYSLGPWVHQRAGVKITWEVFKNGSAAEAFYDNGSDMGELMSQLDRLSRIPGVNKCLLLVRVCELIWLDNDFRLRVSDLGIPVPDMERKFDYYCSKRIKQRESWRKTIGDDLPYTKTNCMDTFVVKQDQLYDIDGVDYVRPGRAWTSDEVSHLTRSVFQDWDEEYGELEKVIPEPLRVVATKYFGTTSDPR